MDTKGSEQYDIRRCVRACMNPGSVSVCAFQNVLPGNSGHFVADGPDIRDQFCQMPPFLITYWRTDHILLACFGGLLSEQTAATKIAKHVYWLSRHPVA